MKNKNFIWINLIFLLFDLFWIWWSFDFVFKYYKEGSTSLAALAAVGVIVWTSLFYKDVHNMNKEFDKSDKTDNDNE